MKLQKLIISVCLTVTLSSCNSVLVYHMDLLRPGAFVASSDKSSILFVDHSVVQPSQFGHTFPDFLKSAKDTAYRTEKLSEYVLNALSDYLGQEGAYQQIKVCKREDYDFNKKEEYFLRSGALTLSQVKYLGDSCHADLLVSMDRLVVQSNTKTQPFEYAYRGTRDVTVNTVWRIYDVAADSLITQFQHNDSLYWEMFSSGPRSSMEVLPPFEETLPEIGDYVGEHVYKFFGPYWETQERSYFCTGSYRMKQAVDCVRQEDWEGAASLWRKEFEKGFGKSVYRAAMNMMLYYEFSGNPKEALLWADKAEKVMAKFSDEAVLQDKWILLNYIKSLEVDAYSQEKLKTYFNQE